MYVCYYSIIKIFEVFYMKEKNQIIQRTKITNQRVAAVAVHTDFLIFYN